MSIQSTNPATNEVVKIFEEMSENAKQLAQWEGNLKDGRAPLTTASNILKQTNHSFKT